MDNKEYNKKISEIMKGSARRSRLNLGTAALPDFAYDNFEAKKRKNNLGNLDVLDNSTGEDGNLSSWELLRRSKQLLAMRTVTPELAARLDLRRDWNQHRQVTTLLDCFPSLKYSYSSLRGKKFDSSVSIFSNGLKARVNDVARSHSIRLDPVDAPKELFKYRQRIQKIITWAYAQNLVPVMMTLTVFHRWHDLAPLCRVLWNSWSELFRGPLGLKRKAYIGLRGYVRRMEETFNDGDEDYNGFLNSGWHPHYHVMLIVPRDKLSTLSAYESELQKLWVKLVRKYYRREFGEDISASYLPSFEKHGLFFSRFKSTKHARRCGCRHGRAGDLFEVKEGKYLAKVMGTDSPLYGGDAELTSRFKQSKTPFNLLRCELTANLSDLWCEYAIATKKIACFTFSFGLQAEVDKYFESLHGGASAVSDVKFSTEGEGFIVRLKVEDYKWLYRYGLIGQLLNKASKSFDVAKAWLKESFDIEVLADVDSVTDDENLASQNIASSIDDNATDDKNINPSNDELVTDDETDDDDFDGSTGGNVVVSSVENVDVNEGCDSELDRHSIMLALYQIVLDDDKNFTRTIYVSSLLERLGVDVVHKVSTKNLYHIFRSVVSHFNIQQDSTLKFT